MITISSMNNNLSGLIIKFFNTKSDTASHLRSVCILERKEVYLTKNNLYLIMHMQKISGPFFVLISSEFYL